VLFGGILAGYNFLRFASLTEFGLSYIINDDPKESISLQALLLNIRDYFIMPPRFHSSYPYITLLWEWLLPFDWEKVFVYFRRPCVGMLWVCPFIGINAFIIIVKKQLNKVFYVLLSRLTTGALLLIFNSATSHEARYLADFISYPIISCLIIALVVFIYYRRTIKLLFMLAAFSALASTSIGYFTSLQGNGTFSGDEGALDDLIQHFEKYKQFRPNLDMPYFVLGCFYARQGNIESALLNYQEARRINPTYPGVEERINQINEFRNRQILFPQAK